LLCICLLVYFVYSSTTPVPDASSAQDFPSLGGSSSSSAAAAAAAQQQQQQQHQQQRQRQAAAAAAAQQQQLQQQLDEQSLFVGAPVNFALQGSSSVGLPQPFTLSVSTPQAAAAPDAGSLYAFDAPLQVQAYGSSSGGGSFTQAPAGPAASSGLDELRLNLAGLNTSAPSANTGPAAAAAAAPAAAARGGPVHLLHLLAQRREAAAAAAAGGSGSLSPAGDQPVSRLGFASNSLGSSAAVGTPTGVSSSSAAAAGVAASGSRANGSIGSSSKLGGSGKQGKGGVLRSMLETLEQVSEALCCPITHEVFVDPVVAADGITYERSAIVDWLSTHDTSPMTNTVLPNLQLHPNSLVKTLVEELL
jgi:hypothetical protein